MITKSELTKIGMLKRELEIDRRRLYELKNSSLIASARLTGAHASSGPGDPTALIADRAVSLEAAIALKAECCLELLLKLQHFINTIDDSEQRMVFYLKYVKCYSWTRIALEIGLGDEQLARKHHNRYLKQRGIN